MPCRRSWHSCPQSLVSLCVCLSISLSRFWYPFLKWPNIDGFQILRCLWKCLDETLQSIMLKFSYTKKLSKKDPLKVLKITFTNFRRNIGLFIGKIWIWLFYPFFHWGATMLHKKSQVHLIKNKSVMAVYVILHIKKTLKFKNF